MSINVFYLGNVRIYGIITIGVDNMNIFKNESGPSPVDKKIIDNLRGLSIDIIDNAKSGHPGIALGAAPILYTLYANHLNFSLENDKWINRDRFILSAGHGSSLLYATLYMAGFPIEIEDLKSFRHLSSITPGHPEYGLTPGVDMSTGPLGQGIASSVGVAIAEEYLSHYFGKNIIDYYTYVLCGDGDLMEGVSYEALAIAGRLALNKLIVLYDSNDVTLDGKLENSSLENTRLRFESINWNYILVNDGEDITSINEAINKAKNSDKPTMIEVKTTIGKFSKNQGTSKVHGSPLDEEDMKAIKNKLNLRDIPFSVSSEAVANFQQMIKERHADMYNRWNEEVSKLDEVKKEELSSLINNKEPLKIKDIYYEIPEDGMEATRVSSGKILNSIAKNYPFMMGGSADVASSTHVTLKDEASFSQENRLNRNISFGIREHAMASIANGMALSGITPFVSTFFSFSDYLKPAIRMSALMDLPVLYIFTHDSITVGEDGPTHQPVEQLVMLRATPNLDVYRPYDANEVLGSYKAILESRRPSALVLSRNKVPLSEETKVNDVKKGAYILGDEHGALEAVLISTGEEVEIAFEVYQTLMERGISIRLVSMPSTSVFERQSMKYQQSIIPNDVPTFVIELSSSYSWYKYTNNQEHLFTIDHFGESGSRESILEKYEFTSEKIANRIEKLLK